MSKLFSTIVTYLAQAVLAVTSSFGIVLRDSELTITVAMRRDKRRSFLTRFASEAFVLHK